MNFKPVADLWELDSLDHDLVMEGYLSAERGDPEPGPNRGKSYWHGWRCRMMDYGVIPIDEVHQKLTRDYLAQQREALQGHAREANKVAAKNGAIIHPRLAAIKAGRQRS